MAWSVYLTAVLGSSWVGDVTPLAPPAHALMERVSGHDRLAMGCVAAPLASVDQMAAAVGAGGLASRADALSASFVAAAADTVHRAPGSLAWLRLGDDPMVGAVVGASIAPLAAGDRWTDHWVESPRLQAGTDRVLRISPHGRVPSVGQWRPAVELGVSGLPAHVCAAWSVRSDDRGERKVERILAVSSSHASLRTLAASARRTDVGARVDSWTLAPASRRHPEAVLIVHSLPHVVTGAPWLQSTDLPKKIRGLGSLIPSGYTAAGGQVRAWFDDVSGAAMAVILPLNDASGQPAGTHALLSDVQERFSLPGDVEPTGRGGRLLAGTGGVHIGALPGALLLSTDADVLVDLLHGHGRAWPHPPASTEAAAAVWLAGPERRAASTGLLIIEDGMWRLDASGATAPLEAMSHIRAWAGIE